MLLLDDALLGHAVETAHVAAVGNRQSQIVYVSPEGVSQLHG